MLKLILGLSGTGKSYTVYSELKRLALEGKKSILIVPEQFSQGAEIRVYRLLGDRLCAYVTIYSFSSFAEHILKEYGSAAIKTLSDAGRVVYVRRAMEAVSAELARYGSHRRSPSFCAMCADVIAELKTAGATPEDLKAASSDLPSGDKLRELALIYAAYNALIANTALDSADRIALAAQKPFEGDIVRTNVFVDNFDGFTAPEYKLFEKLFLAESCTVTLCCESLHDAHGGLSLQSPVKKTAARLRSLAQRKQISVASPQILQKDMRHVDSKILQYIAEKILDDAVDCVSADSGEFYVNAYNSRYSEAKATAAHIAHLASKGVQYSDFAIICRELDNYAAPLKSELTLFNIPFFTDETLNIEHTAPAVFLRAALAILKNGLSSEAILRLLKSGICGVDENDLSVLENYAYTWALKSAEWREPFTKNPQGFQNMTDADKVVLDKAEQLRIRTITPIEKCLSSVKNANAENISRALYSLMEDFNAAQNTLKNASELSQYGNEELSAALCRSWELAMEFLSEMPLLLDNCDINAAEYDELLLLLMQSAKIGAVPQMQDAVLVTTADRMRLESPRYCFVLGVSEGEFPKAVGASGLLTHADRDALVRHGIEMPGGFENRMLLEQMFFYKAFTSSKIGLYASFVPAQFGGAEQAAQLASICTALLPKAAVLTNAQLAATPDAALDLLCEQGYANTSLFTTINNVLKNNNLHESALMAMERAHNAQDFSLGDRQALRSALGASLTLSPTRIERWHSCRFSYFMEYILRIKPIRKAELSPLESGSLVHYVLENVMREAGASFACLPLAQLHKLANETTDRYIKEKMPDNSLRFERIIARIKQSVTKLLEHIQAEQQQSSFEPIAFEEEIAEGFVEPMVFETPDGERVKIVGKIDRVDVMRRDGKSYIRVVDYKTGSKKFSLSDVYSGLNMQMLIYLFTLCKNGGEKYENAHPAGVLYLLADPSPQTLARDEAHLPLTFDTDGILLDDEAVLRAMDSKAQGIFIPVRFNKDGTARKTTKLASLEKLGRIEMHIKDLLTQMAMKLYEGDIAARPLVLNEKRPCDTCDYRPVCRHEDGFNEQEAVCPEHVFEPNEQDKEIIVGEVLG